MMKEVTPYMMVREFHEKYGHPIGVSITEDELNRRWLLIQEEVDEVTEEMPNLDNSNNKVDKEKLTKELADLLYVVYGTAVAFGLPIDLVFRRTHLSNMSKSTKKDKNGKTIKGPSYEPPVLRDLFEGGI